MGIISGICWGVQWYIQPSIWSWWVFDFCICGC